MIQDTGIWKNSFGSDNKTNSNIQRLTVSLESLREKAAHLTSKISEALPHLTIHDITHLDALWDVADIIVGEDFPLNPLEAYVFGSAVLLHDAALCFQAYAGGQDGLRETVEWRDAYARLSSLTDTVEETRREADFEALRHLHASHAPVLACDPWKTLSGDLIYLIEDVELRENYGRLIGEIAASHHWDIEVVAERFSNPRPPAHFFQSNWIIDPLKIACMLRVADAGHMDGARAPSFLLKLLEMNSVSQAHWISQNHLGRVFVNPQDQTQLIIASTSPFLANEAAAWWVAFDAITLFNKEIQSCNEVLCNPANGTHPQFARQSVVGAGNIDELKKYVETSNWEPTDTKIHVSDVASLIQRLGGAELYGTEDKLEIVIRELIQNSSDAISARQAIDGGNFNGSIFVRLINNPKKDSYVLQIDDNGIGMSSKTLTDDLMDFGKSFWKSSRASQEFPGIHSSGHSPIGRFGIGFFSIFMIAESVKVFSRRYDDGLDAVRCLTFANGLSLRPILSEHRPENFGMDISTRIEIEIKKNVILNPNQMEIRANLMGHTNFHVPFRDYVAAIVSGIGVRVFVEYNAPPSQVHSGFPPKEGDIAEWLKVLSYVKCGANLKVQDIITNNSHLLRQIHDDKECYGLAAINFSSFNGADFLSARAVGGLVSPHSRYDAPFIGLIDHFPKSAKRDPGERVAPLECFNSWLAQQEELLLNKNLDPIQSIQASYSLCNFDYDPIRLFRSILVISQDKTEFWGLDDLAAILTSGKRLGFRLSSLSNVNILESYGQQNLLPDIFTCYVISTGKFNDTELENGIPKHPRSMIGVIHRKLEEKGRIPIWTRIKNAYEGPFGKCDCLEVRV